MSSDVCRTCLGSDAEISLFDTSKNLAVKLLECTHLVISELDNYPSKICEKCCLELHICYNFINKCKSSHDILLSQIVALDERDKCDSVKLEYDVLDEIASDTFENGELDNKVKENSDREDDVDGLISSKNDDDNSRRLNTLEFFNFSDSDRDLGRIFSTVLNDSKKKSKRKRKKVKIKKKLSKSDKMKLYASKTEQQCRSCGLRVVSSSALSIHMRTHTGEKPFKCSFCHKSFALKSTLQEHVLRLHSNADKNITCESCGKQFYKERDLIVHMRVHTKETPYLCPYCPRRFTQHASIIKHIRTHTGERPFTCKICGKTFTCQSHVKSHESSHSDLKPHKCDTCGKAVKNKHSLAQHIKRHIGGKDFVCDQCGSSFSTKGNLVVHVTTIHSERSGICHLCNKSCSNLENHIKMHTGESLFECQYCNKKFRKCNLSNHLVKHTNSGKFKCEVDKCFKSFSTKNLLEFHFLKYHLKTPQYMCNHCMKGFYRPCDLATHSRRSHGNKTSNG